MDIFNEYNRICVDLPKVTRITEWRKARVDAISKEFKDDNAWTQFFYRVQDSDFLSGRSTKWRASFDWIVKPANFTKIIEGNYDNRKTRQTNQKIQQSGSVNI